MATKGKSGRGHCGVCRHKARHQIDLAIAAGVSAYIIGERFDLSSDAVYRHAKAHLSPVQRAALLTASQPLAIDLEQLRTSESENLLSSLVAQRARLSTYGETAAELGDIPAATRVESAILENLKVVGKLLQQFVTVHDVRHSSILISPDYLKLRQTLVDTLRAFPDAGRAVAAALHRLESDAATDIMARAGKAAAPEPLLITDDRNATTTEADRDGVFRPTPPTPPVSESWAGRPPLLFSPGSFSEMSGTPDYDPPVLPPPPTDPPVLPPPPPPPC